MLKVEEIHARYGDTKILEDICFSAKEGRLLGIIGPNGSGKTTLLKVISSIIKPEIGTVILDNFDIVRMKKRDIAKKMAVVPQESSTSFSFTAIEVVLMGRTPHLKRFETEDSKDFEIARRCMRMTDCLNLAERPIDELSGGELQKVIIARALAQEPKILLMDEPTSHLDIKNQIEILDLMKKLADDGLTVISVLHDINMAARYCDELILLKDGKIVSAGITEDVLTTKNIKNVFGISVSIKRDPLTGSFSLSIIPERKQKIKKPLKIHLVCGGSSGSFLMHLLNEEYEITAGVIHESDTDYEVARAIGIELVSEAPFSPISDEMFRKNLDMIKRSDTVILADIPFGFGNIKNLYAIKSVLKKEDKKVLIIDKTPIDDRDFTNGEATEIFKSLKDEGCIFFKDIQDLLNYLNEEKSKDKIRK
jgi:iron complex transport system ATP-binding protein